MGRKKMNIIHANCISEKEFIEKIKQHAVDLKSFSMSLCKDMFNSDDLIQETLLRAWKSKHLFEKGTNFAAWIITIMRNQFISNIRKNQKKPTDYFDNTELIRTIHSHTINDHNSNTQNTFNDDILNALNQMSDDLKMAILLCDAYDYTYEEIAKICNTPVGTIRSRLFRARKTMKEILSK